MIIMNPIRYAESNQEWMDREYAAFVNSSGFRTQKSPLPDKSIYIPVTLIPGQIEEAKKELRKRMDCCLEFLKINAGVLYPDLIVYPNFYKDCYYLFTFEIRYA